MVFVLNKPDDDSSFVLNKLDGASFVLNRLVDDGFSFALNRLVDDEILEDDVVSWFLNDCFIWAFKGSVIDGATAVGVAFFGFDSDIKGVSLLLGSEKFTVGEVLLFNVDVATVGGAFDDEVATVGGTLDVAVTVGGILGVVTVGGILNGNG